MVGKSVFFGCEFFCVDFGSIKKSNFTIISRKKLVNILAAAKYHRDSNYCWIIKKLEDSSRFFFFKYSILLDKTCCLHSVKQP